MSQNTSTAVMDDYDVSKDSQDSYFEAYREIGRRKKYSEFLNSKTVDDVATGIADPRGLPRGLFNFQSAITKWALRRGRAAIFAGTGTGKSFMELAWANEVSRYTNKPVLIFAPIAVASQIVRVESKKFNIPARIVRDQSDVRHGVNVTNYQKMENFDLASFGGVVLDESSILKSTTGIYRTRLIKECSVIPFRLAATATPAPNDFMELGNHAEFLGVMSYTDMLASFFTHDGGETQKWVLKKWAEDRFWEWLASWSVMLRHPRDLGFEHDGYDLPPLIRHHHIVKAEYEPSIDTGMLFPMRAESMSERIGARRHTIDDRVAKAISITPNDRPFLWWCNMNAESKAITAAIPDAVEVCGSDKDDDKERKIINFVEGHIRVLVTKPSIAGFGMNFQHCADTGFVGLNDSFEQIYQATRRFWRFGQTKPVNVHFIASELEGAVVQNIKRKEENAELMADAMAHYMTDLSSKNVRGLIRDRDEYNPAVNMKLPSWM